MIICMNELGVLTVVREACMHNALKRIGISQKKDLEASKSVSNKKVDISK